MPAKGPASSLMINLFSEANIIHVYSRAQAIEDGALIDVTATAMEAGIKHPVSVTNQVWAELIVPAKVLRERFGQYEDGRLWDVVWMLRSAITGLIKPVKHYREGLNDVIHFQVYALMLVKRQKITRDKVIDYKRRELQLVTLKAVCGPGDNMEPVITIMFPDES